MSEDEEKKREAIRERVLVFLSFFTSSESQRAFAPAVPEEKLAYELCDIWFDKVFVSSTRYMEGLRGDWDEVAAAEFRDAFDDEEWKFLERFHRFLELRIDMMPAAQKAGRTIPANNLWDSILRDAKYLFELLEPDLKKRHLIGDSLYKGLLAGNTTFSELPGHSDN